MENPISATADAIEALVKSARELQHPHNALSISQLSDNARTTVVVLEASQQKYRVWRKTWMENVRDPEKTAQELWGSAGWEDIRKLLSSIQDAVNRVRAEIVRPYDADSGPQIETCTKVSLKMEGSDCDCEKCDCEESTAARPRNSIEQINRRTLDIF